MPVYVKLLSPCQNFDTFDPNLQKTLAYSGILNVSLRNSLTVFGNGVLYPLCSRSRAKRILSASAFCSLVCVCLNIFITINLYVAETYKPSLFAYRPRFCRVRLTQLRHKRLIFFGCIIRLSLHNQNFWLSFLSGFIFLCFSITIKKRYVYFAYL